MLSARLSLSFIPGICCLLLNSVYRCLAWIFFYLIVSYYINTTFIQPIPGSRKHSHLIYLIQPQNNPSWGKDRWVHPHFRRMNDLPRAAHLVSLRTKYTQARTPSSYWKCIHCFCFLCGEVQLLLRRNLSKLFLRQMPSRNMWLFALPFPGIYPASMIHKHRLLGVPSDFSFLFLSALATAATSLPSLVPLWNFARFQVRINITFFGHRSKSASCYPLTNHMLATPSFLELCKCPENRL